MDEREGGAAESSQERLVDGLVLRRDIYTAMAAMHADHACTMYKSHNHGSFSKIDYRTSLLYIDASTFDIIQTASTQISHTQLFR